MNAITQRELYSLYSPEERDAHLLSAVRANILRAMLRVDSGIMPNEITVRLDTTVQKGADLDTVLGLDRVHITLGKHAAKYLEAFRTRLAAMTGVAVIHSQKNKSELIFCGTPEQLVLAEIDPHTLAARIRNQKSRGLDTYRGVTR